MSKVLVMVLAGGRGKRMGILCHERPKPALPFLGAFRVIDFSLSNSVHSGFRDIAVLTDYHRRYLRDYLGNGAPWGLDKQGKLDILEPDSGAYSGTAGALYHNLSYIEASGADHVLILAADHVYKMDYRSMIASHKRTGADLTVAVTPVPWEEAHRFGLANVDSEDRVREFVEKPEMPQCNLASMGIYVFRRAALMRRLEEDAADLASPHDFGLAVIPRMVHLDEVFAYRFQGYWQDIGTEESYYQANLELISGAVSFSMNDAWPVLTGESEWTSRTARSLIGGCLLSPGSVIRGRVERSIISPGVTVSPGTIVRDSVILANCVIGRHSVVNRCILDEEVTVGELSHVGFGEDLLSEKGGITVVGRGAVIPSQIVVGRGCRVWPGTSPGDFPATVVPPGTVVSPQLTSPHLLVTGVVGGLPSAA